MTEQNNKSDKSNKAELKAGFLGLWLGVQSIFLLVLCIGVWQVYSLNQKGIKNGFVPPGRNTHANFVPDEHLAAKVGELTIQSQNLFSKLSQIENQIKGAQTMGTSQTCSQSNFDTRAWAALMLTVKLSVHNLCGEYLSHYVGLIKPRPDLSGRVGLPNVFEEGYSSLELSAHRPNEVELFCQKALSLVGALGPLLKNLGVIQNTDGSFLHKK